MKLVIITWAAFFLRQKPVSTRAKPACMNITRNPVTRVQAKLMAILFLPTASVTAFAWPCSTPMSAELPVTSPQGSPAAELDATLPPQGGGASWAWAACAQRPSNATTTTMSSAAPRMRGSTTFLLDKMRRSAGTPTMNDRTPSNASSSRVAPASASRPAGTPPGDVAAGPALPLELHQAPDLDAVRADVGLDVGGHATNGGQVDAEDLRAPVEGGGDRPVAIGVVAFPGSHRSSLVERVFDFECRRELPQRWRPSPGSSTSSVADLPAALLLHLEDAERVLARVDDPRRPGKPDVGDAVLGLQARQVVVLHLDAA